ncbi:TrmH family RNA methyltransferase [Actinosynnema mirum]|uniref:tRNA/rRNA methyltransferase (SpoU) n=1 Tax=Actinosynnema mirum (strain ATCC 29888 / DSM 43827 / JCM 3225 / NBRC 14064 / NCIMB 13271 / NRRL B-12336 / IMRU 3971 / 101) TaxID=446462 RepID=C6WA99_ACTMD|nr:RNA methyltransferase [Actinosynnema mirum]ACU39288.1 tRNA/rRNA methyltransferase (SpoU) [Actinosynnema mirum DSM 43827]
MSDASRAPRPADVPFTERTPRVVAARRLTRRSGRDRAARFLAEGAQAVREALAWSAAGRGRVHELFVTEVAAERNQELVDAAASSGVPISVVTDKAAAALSETVTPQGVVAVCDPVEVPLDAALTPSARLVAVLHGVGDPGNAGTVVRVADAAGADAVVFAGDSVDVHNGKCVRASTGSVFHLPIARARSAEDVFAACRAAGLRLVAADGYATEDLVTADLRGDLAHPTAWVFGSEAHGLPDEVVTSLDGALKVPLYGGAESLNLATAAAVCLYASARAHRA